MHFLNRSRVSIRSITVYLCFYILFRSTMKINRPIKKWKCLKVIHSILGKKSFCKHFFYNFGCKPSNFNHNKLTQLIKNYRILILGHCLLKITTYRKFRPLCTICSTVLHNVLKKGGWRDKETTGSMPTSSFFSDVFHTPRFFMVFSLYTPLDLSPALYETLTQLPGKFIKHLMELL